VYPAQRGRHWVGDGFPVRTLFSYPNLGPVLSPFLLLDYAGTMEFPATEKRLGVGEHPHRGFETLTVVYSGEVEHRDSSGGGGRIGAGDVLRIDSADDATALLLCGAPIDEPIVGSGPFVMNTADEIRQAIAEYQSGKMGRLS
jgi:redox-sensitive bicupin YhaK (pirin superfamily)